MLKNRREKSGGERGRRECCQWKASGQCSKGNNCSFRHDESQSGKLTPESASSSELQKDGEEFARKKNPRSGSTFGKWPRKPCRDCLQGKCTKPSCDLWHPPECQTFKQPSGCRFGEMCAFKHQKVEKQPDRKPRKNGDNSAAALLKNSRHTGCVFH